MHTKRFDTLVVMGPTATAKTRLGVRLAHALEGEILSADSRQVYRGLNLGAGKDLDEYKIYGTTIPYHLIDITELTGEFSVFAYQRAFFDVYESVRARGTLPIVVGGTGLYLEAVLKGYRMVEVPINHQLRAELAKDSNEALAQHLLTLKPRPHNTTDLLDRERLLRAIEIAEYTHKGDPGPTPELNPLVLGTRWDRELLRKRIHLRLKERLDAGLIEEVERLHAAGHSWERLALLGLEYRFVTEYLTDKIHNQNDLLQKLNSAIVQFVKRQNTWFRRMERQGTYIHWIRNADFDGAMDVVRAHE